MQFTNYFAETTPLSDTASMSSKGNGSESGFCCEGERQESELGGLWVGTMQHETVVTAMEHESGVFLDERNRVTVEVAEHGVAAPAADDADVIGVNAGEEECHGSAGAEGSDCNV